MTEILGQRVRIFIGLATFLLCAIPAAADISQLKHDVQITSYLDPAYDGQRFKSIIVYAPDLPLDKRLTIESLAATRLNQIGISAQRGIDLIPPTRDENESNRNDLLLKSGLEALLTLKTYETSVSISKEDSIVAPGATLRRLDPQSGKFVPYQTPPTLIEGTITEIPRGEYSLTLSTIKDMRVIWKASVKASGNYENGLGEVVFSRGIEEIRRLNLI